MICIGIWTNKDAKRKNLNANLWTTLTVILPYFIGYIVYICVNPKHNMIQCSFCGSIMKKNMVVCPSCGAHMATSQQPIPPADPANKKFFIGYVVGIVGNVAFYVLAFLLVFR